VTESALENLKVKVKDGKPCEKVLTIEVPPDAIQKEFEEFYKAVAPNAQVPGFRPGKAPRHVIEMHYRESAREHVLKNLISESFKHALTTEVLEPLGYPKIQDVDFKDTCLSYKACIEIRPKIKLNRYKGLEAKKEKAEVKPEEIEHELTHIQESLAQYKTIDDRPVQMGDFVITDYACTVDGKEIDRRVGDWLEVREKEFLQGFSVQLIGMKPGDEKKIELKFPETMGRKELAGKPAEFQVKVKEIKTKTLPPLSDELAKESGDFSTLEELKSKTHQNLLTKKERETETSFEKALLDELVKQNKMDLPEGVVQRRVEYLLEETKHSFLGQGGAEEMFEKQKEQLSKEMEPEAKRQVQVSFLLDEIAIKENITVTEEEQKQRYQQIAERVRQPLEQVAKYYGENENAREALAEQIRNEKTIQMIKDNAKQKR